MCFVKKEDRYKRNNNDVISKKIEGGYDKYTLKFANV